MMKWPGQIASTTNKRNSHTISVGKREERPWSRWVENIKEASRKYSVD